MFQDKYVENWIANTRQDCCYEEETLNSTMQKKSLDLELRPFNGHQRDDESFSPRHHLEGHADYVNPEDLEGINFVLCAIN